MKHVYRKAGRAAIEGKVITVLAWTEQVKCRGLSEQPIDIRLVRFFSQFTSLTLRKLAHAKYREMF